jgi:gliding motility-associated-like protein
LGAQCVSVGSDVTICQGSKLKDLKGALLNKTTKLIWSDNGAGGTFSPNATTLKASWTPPAAFSGIATLTLTATAGCTSTPSSASFRVTVTALPVATFSYTASPYCSNEPNPFPTFSGGAAAGTFSSTAGLVFVNSSTGQVNLAASNAGTYTVTNTIPASGGCSIVTATGQIIITTAPAATISYAGAPFCKSISTDQPVTRTGTSGGTYSATPAGLSINESTGEITPGTSTAGTYTVIYTLAGTGGCGVTTATTSVTITSPPVATFIYSASPYCPNGNNPLPTFIGGGVPGIFSSTPGLIFVNTSTGQVNLSASTAGTYTVTNTIASSEGCGIVTSASPVTIKALPSAPLIGTITAPTCIVLTGSVVLTGLPSTGSWMLNYYPGNVSISGTGISTTVSGLNPGTYNFSVTNADGCISTLSNDAIVPLSLLNPPAPVIGTVTQPTCILSTGSVVINGLPSTGTWTLTRNPGGITVSGIGTTTTVSSLPPGTYSFTVTNSSGCLSMPSENVLVNSQPPMPPAPLVGAITAPTCILSTGSVVLSGLPSSGTWTLIRYPGTDITTGTGASTTITGLPPGTYNYTVTNSGGCLSVPSENVVIPEQPSPPAAPIVGPITQPTFYVPRGSVVLGGLPSTGSWIISRLPDMVTTAGTGTITTITDLEAGIYVFTVTNSAGCISTASSEVVIKVPGAPVLKITNPAPVCLPSTVNITNPGITAGSSPGLTFSYWTNAEATLEYSTPTMATSGTYFIKGTNVSGYFDIKPVIVTIDSPPLPDAGIDQVLDYQFSTALNASLGNNEKGIWSLVSGTVEFGDATDPKTEVSDLSFGKNVLLWTVTSGACTDASDTIIIVVNDLILPTLITPNMDGRNDFFVINGLAVLGKTELTIFDRRGVMVYKNPDYDNKWDGVDYNNNPLTEDTYFYIFKSLNGKSGRGYIVIRR